MLGGGSNVGLLPDCVFCVLEGTCCDAARDCVAMPFVTDFLCQQRSVLLRNCAAVHFLFFFFFSYFVCPW